MLIESYPNPNKPPVKTYPRYDYPVSTLPSRLPDFHLSYYDHQARKRNITVEEYKRRDAIVRAEYNKVFYRKGSEVYPHTEELYKVHGKCIVDSMYQAYSQFEEDDVWPASDIPYIVAVHEVKDNKATIFATANFFTLIDPTEKEASPI